jgi:excisionase family DNA binding protein
MNDNASVERLLTIPEVAEIFQVSTKTVRRAIAAGELRAHRVGRQWRIAPREVLRYLKDGVL